MDELNQYLFECRESLKTIVLNIEGINENSDHLDTVAKELLSINSGAKEAEFEAVERVSQHIYDIIKLAQTESLEISDPMEESIFEALDEVLNLVEAAEESGEVVSGDEAVINNTILELSHHIKNTQNTLAWEPPFKLIEDIASVVELDVVFSDFKARLPYEASPLKNQTLNERRLYAIRFTQEDITYDPVTLLDSFANRVVAIKSCFDVSSAKELLAGFDQASDLLLRGDLVAFVYAGFDEISEVFDSQIETLEFLPLDLKTLSSVDFSDKEDIDLVKDLVVRVSKALSIGDIELIETSISHALDLINKNLRLAFLLKRLMLLIDVCDSEEYPLLAPYLSNLLGQDVKIGGA